MTSTTGGVRRRARDRSRFAGFRWRDAPSLDETGMMQYVPSPASDAASARLVGAGVMDGSLVTQLFRHDGDDGFSLVHAWFKPNYDLPRHSHSADCLYYVVSGQVVMGSQVFGAGDGFYVPCDHAYGYRTGPEGAEVLEFRHATRFDIKLTESAAGFERILRTVEANRERWQQEKVPPSLR